MSILNYYSNFKKHSLIKTKAFQKAANLPNLFLVAVLLNKCWKVLKFIYNSIPIDGDFFFGGGRGRKYISIKIEG